MKIDGIAAIVTGGASGIGLATARALIARGAKVVIADVSEEAGDAAVAEIGSAAQFIKADVTSEQDMESVCDAADAIGPLRVLVHCAGRGGSLRILDKEGKPGALDAYESFVRINLTGSFNALRLAAARMARLDPAGEERGVCVLTASIAAFEGQIGQVGYASSKAGVVGMTLVAARDLASRGIRICTIAPGVVDTPMLRRLIEEQRAALGKAVPFPSRLGRPEEYASLAIQIVENTLINGETIRLDGGLRMPPR
jgi:NAD(P)-dependent dehydrogenase (short-subunit alcohol dehydrogenase family)